MVVLTLGLFYRFVPPISTLMIADAFSLKGYKRQVVPMRSISPNITRAVIRAEDGKFCAHRGVDWESLNKAVAEAIDEESAPRGASTIPMQVAKNLFLWPHRSYARKVLELPLAMYLDFIWPKSRMMHAYLSIAEWGNGVYGIEAASRHYFGKSAKSLSPREASLLAAALPNPRKRSPARPSAFLSQYAASIEQGMWDSDISCLK